MPSVPLTIRKCDVQHIVLTGVLFVISQLLCVAFGAKIRLSISVYAHYKSDIAVLDECAFRTRSGTFDPPQRNKYCRLMPDDPVSHRIGP